MAKQSVEQGEMLALLRKKAAGSYGRAKEAEAKAGGRSLPTKLKNAVARATGLKLDRDKNDNLYCYLYANCVEPVEYAGIHAGTMFSLSESEYRSFEQSFEQFIGALKLLGYADWIPEDEGEFFNTTLPQIIENIETEKPYFYFNTSNREKKDGSVNIFVAGPVEADYVPPEREEDRNKHEAKGYAKSSKAPETKKAKAPTQTSDAKKTTKGAKGAKATLTVTPPGKKPPSKKPVKKCPFAVDDLVDAFDNPFFEDDVDPEDVYTLRVREINTANETCEVSLPSYTSSDRWTVPWGKLRPAAPDSVGLDSEGPTFSVGSPVTTIPDYFGDGKTYSGTIIEVNDDTVLVEFEDGDKLEIPPESLSLI